MRFPQLLIDVDEYYSQLTQLIAENDCHLFFDTNIISQMYRLNSAARNEFYYWLNSLSTRAHVPNWAIHEYSNRFLTEKTSDYLGELAKLSSLPKTLEEITNFLRMYVDECLLVNSKYRANKELLFTELETISTNLRIISNALGNKEIQKVKLQVHQEMVEKFQAIALDSKIVNLLENFGMYYSFRYEHKYPPGFKDSNKEYNSAGDLLLWQEILQYSKEKEIKKVVLVTRDMKKDFVYAPKQIKENGIIKSNSQNKIKIADERLVDEFRSTVGTETFYIINFQQLVGVLSKSSSSQYRNLSVSVQIDPYFVSQTADKDNCELDSLEETSELVDSSEIPHEENIDTASSISQIETGTVAIEQEITTKREMFDDYSQEALADKKFTLDERNKLHAIISDLRSHNWPIQNLAVDKLYSVSSARAFEVTKEVLDSFFVLGRNVYQAACGNAFKAISLIENLSSFLSNIEQHILRKAFLDGALYEVYFDHDNEYRKGGCRGDYLRSLESCLKQEEYSDSFEFINKRLKTLPNTSIYYPPLYDRKVIISLSGKIADGELMDCFVVNQMKIDGKISDYPNSITYLPCFFNIDDLKNILSQLLAIDQRLIVIEGVADDVIEKHYLICFGNPLPFK